SWGTTMEELKTDYHGYYSMSTGIDNCVGDIVKALSEKGELENTIFVYTSDHGDNLYSRSFLNIKALPRKDQPA
ncbi:MAG: sulfatase-like hydrolase/transferase, partial [Desulfobacula sp.]|nr:sulfatase-like hydrolase/transferase [Desulfobacula sp.]